MSYKTNPITNRFNINKGWKNSSFPEQLSFYARDNTFFFKIFLFLKAYFAIRKIKLISCEIRVSEEHTPILYLVINTTSRRKKKRSSFIKTFHTTSAGLKFSPLSNPLNNEALNLIFLNLPKLKQVLQSKLLPLAKKKPSQLWLTKPKFRSWLNYVGLIRTNRVTLLRTNSRQRFQPITIHIYQHKIKSRLQFQLAQILKQILMSTKILQLIKQNQSLTPTILSLYKNRLKHMSNKINKINSVLSQIRERRYIKNTSKLNLYQQKRIKNQLHKFKQKQFQIFSQALRKSRFYEQVKKSLILSKDNNIWQKLFLENIYLILKTKHFRLLEKKKIVKLNKMFLFRNSIKELKFSQMNSQPFLKKQRIHLLKKTKHQNQLIQLIFKQTVRQYKLKKRMTTFLLKLHRHLRLKKKTRLNSVDIKQISSEIIKTTNLYKISPKLSKMTKKTETESVSKTNKVPTRNYRRSLRNSYRHNLNILVRYQYKLWIQKVLQTFFQTRFEVKFIQPLTQFKNFKFLRLVYPLNRFRQQTKIKFTHSKKNFYADEEKNLGKRYIYIGTNLKRFLNLQKRQLPNNININTYPFYKKADLFKRLRRKKLQDYAQKRLSSVKNKLLMRQFLPVLTLFIKYLNPQILADHIAKEFEKTKKHRPILFALKTVLRSLKLHRGIGYRIAIVGRINSSTKSRAFYLTRESLIRQNFSKKINYATAQAKARIGSFGIKVWLFY